MAYQGLPFKDGHFSGAHQIPGKILCAYYDAGGEGIAYHDSDAVNHGSGELNPKDGSYLNEFRMDEGVDTSYVKYFSETDNSPYNKVLPPEGHLYIGWTAPGEWVKYTVNVATSGTYNVKLLFTSFRGGKAALSFDDGEALIGDIPSTFDPNDPIDWRQHHHWDIVDLGDILVTEGQHLLKLETIENGQINYAYLEFSLK